MAGIKEVVIIVQEDDYEAFRLFFNTPVSIENFNQLPKPFQAYAKQIVEMGRYISFAIQPNQEGFGHAVYCTREILAEEPFLLLLGDHLYRSNGEKSCTRQLLDAYQQHGTSILGLRRTAEDQIANFGTVAGVWMKEDKLLNNTEFSEKPTVDYARSHLRVPGLPDGEHLTVFGQYILQPQLFDFLEEHIKNNVRERGEFQLTSTLDRMHREGEFLGLLMDGQRYDIGLPEYYLDTLQTFVK